MKTIRILFIILFSNSIFAQKTLPIIQANSKIVDIKVGDTFYKKQWTIMPDVNPDIYDVYKTNVKVTFYTDIDSISINITKKTKFDFIILLNKKDTAYTQIKFKESPYLATLKKGKEYSSKKREIPKFTYLDSSDLHLRLIRKKFRLDSVAGKGNEISKLLNIMNWVHNTVRHDGGSNNPKIKNAINLVKVCKSEDRGVNCRMMATILNECYLSMGFKSRMITCMPKPLKFQDCHVINSVYSNQLQKWIWLDPEYDAYIMNENGTLLGLQEVRNRLINNKPLILNPNANWNRQSSQTKERYLDFYMAKNLYRLEAPIHSTYNYETREDGKNISYIQLLPLDGLNQEPKIVVISNTKDNMTSKTYITNNPNQFWENK